MFQYQYQLAAEPIWYCYRAGIPNRSKGWYHPDQSREDYKKREEEKAKQEEEEEDETDEAEEIEEEEKEKEKVEKVAEDSKRRQQHCHQGSKEAWQ